MYGGVKPYQTVLKDFWILDTETWTWQRGPDGPGPRADHTLLQYYEYIIVVSGTLSFQIPYECFREECVILAIS